MSGEKHDLSIMSRCRGPWTVFGLALERRRAERHFDDAAAIPYVAGLLAGDTYALAGAFAVVLLGVFAAGPWITALVARVLGRFGRTPPTLVASRRLQDNPKVAFRAIGGLTLAVFLATTFSGIAASALARKGQRPGNDAFPPGMLIASPADFGFGGVQAATSNPMLQQLAATRGLTRVIEVRALPSDVTATNDADAPLLEDSAHLQPGLVRCHDAAVLGLAPCEGTVAIAPQLGKPGLNTFALSRPVAESELDGTPLVALAVGTDGQSAAIERARTLIVQVAPGAMPTTGGRRRGGQRPAAPHY
jgi:hypothetical protein